MTPQLKGYDFRSNPEIYTAGATTTFRADYLTGAAAWNAPTVWEIAIVFSGTIAAAGDHVANAALGRDAAKLFSLIKFRLQNQDVYLLSGAAARVVEQLEYGGRQVDPADVAANVANANYRFILRIPFACHRNLRRHDTSVPLSDFLKSGELTVTFAATPPTGFGPVQPDWKVRLFAFVREERIKEAKSQRRIKEVAVTNQELSYDIGGFLRSGFLTTALTTTGYTDTSVIANVNSTTLGWPAAYEVFMLRDHYRRELQFPNALDEFLLAAPGALPLIFPEISQKTGKMPNVRSLHLDLLQAPPAGLRLVTDTIVDRHPDAVTNLFKYDNAQQAVAQAHAHGVVVGQAGNYPIGAVPADLQRALPFRIKPGGVPRS